MTELLEVLRGSIGWLLGGGVLAGITTLVLFRQRIALENQKVKSGSVDIEGKKIDLQERELKLHERLGEEVAELHEQIIEIRRSLRVVVEELEVEKLTNTKLVAELKGLQRVLQEREREIVKLERAIKSTNNDKTATS